MTIAHTGRGELAEGARLDRRSVLILMGASTAVAMGNNGMISILPAIARTVGIRDAMVAAVFSLSALLWAACSPFWARLSDQRGRKPLILLGLVGFFVSMLLCSLVVGVGLRHLAGPMTIFVCLLLARALFGLFGSATAPATQAYLAERTPARGRTRMMANLAGAFGLGGVLGPLLAPLFVFPIVGLAGPMLTFAAIAGALLLLVWVGVKEVRSSPDAAPGGEAGQGTEAASRRVSLWRDPRVRTFLGFGFLSSGCQNALIQTIGFLIIDKAGVSPQAAQPYVAGAMFSGAITALLAQWFVVRAAKMSAADLMRWGAVLGALGCVLIAASPSYISAVIGYAVASLGFGFARPGFTAGASLAMPLGDQGRVAGAVAAVNGINVAFAPLFVLLYEADRRAPFILMTVVLVGLFVLALKNPALRRTPHAAA